MLFAQGSYTRVVYLQQCLVQEFANQISRKVFSKHLNLKVVGSIIIMAIFSIKNWVTFGYEYDQSFSKNIGLFTRKV